MLNPNASLKSIEAAAAAVLTPFADRGRYGDLATLTQEFRPQDGDFDKVFLGEAATQARAAYTPRWETGMVIERNPSQTALSVTAVRATDLVAGDLQGFPGGYGHIADQLAPDSTWVLFRFTVPGDRRGIRYDGLVPVEDGRWAWFPKPWRFIG